MYHDNGDLSRRQHFLGRVLVAWMVFLVLWLHLYRVAIQEVKNNKRKGLNEQIWNLARKVRRFGPVAVVKIWVETNIRETDISRLKLGQLVKIEVDAYPDEQFEGMISRIGNAATSQFAILPKLNEAGSFTKVTQRLRVRIEIDQRQSMLRPGMMVEVFIKANDSPFRSFLMN